MKKFIWIIAILTLAFSAYAFGQNQRKQKKFYNLPEVDDEVLVTFRKKQVKPKVSHRKKSTKRKAKPFFDEADVLFGKKRKVINLRRK